ncbi:MAG: hypothetical protein SF053_21670 [Bacteroidia bacterium]|nr:hypothetical protein [Bacteroidia bacterium]
MRHLITCIFLLPLTTLAQVGQPCTPQLVISYDAAGNRIQRKDICDIGSASTSGETGEGFRGGSGRDPALPATVTLNPGSVFLIQVFLSCSRVGDWSCAGKTRWIADTRHSLAPAGGNTSLWPLNRR